MKIGPFENKAALSPIASERKSTPSSPAGTTEPSAKVELSASALLANDAEAAVFDSAKVNRIADAIRAGKFQINAEVIADKLISNAEELLGASRKV